MRGIMEFLAEVGGNPALSSTFVSLVIKPDVDQDELLAFFRNNNYGDVTPDDVTKIMVQRNNIQAEFSVPPDADY